MLEKKNYEGYFVQTWLTINPDLWLHVFKWFTFIYLYLDYNECTNGDANCNHYCYNTGGSYYCYCKVGYELTIDDETCVGK